MSSLVNKARGEAALSLGGMTYRLCLTLGALAEIESALGVETLGGLESRLKSFSARDLTAVLAALLRGGGNPIAEETLEALPFDIAAAMRALGEAFAAAGFASTDEDGARTRTSPPGEAGAPLENGSGGAGSPLPSRASA